MQVSIRDALVQAIHADFIAAYPSIPIVYDNAAFDRNSPPPTWVEYEVAFLGGDPIGMAQNPRTRLAGFVYVTVWTRAGTGSRASLAIGDWFATKLAYKSFSGVMVQAAEPGDEGAPPSGWFTRLVKFYFYADPT